MRILRHVLQHIVDHARNAAPAECCGILMSTGENDPVVREALPAENAAHDHPHRSYILGHRAHLQAVRAEAEGRGLIVGYYHSHPQGPPIPSQQDEQLALEGVEYLIVSLTGAQPHCSVWRCHAHRLAQQPLEIVEEIGHE